MSDTRDESPDERYDRNMNELLQELRVALPGVQVLFAFLLTVPFAQRFGQVTEFQTYVYFVTLLCSCVATAFFIAPTAYHRLNFRQGDKGHIVDMASRLAIMGLVALALATLLDFLVAFGIALLAFWTESTSSIALIYDRLVMLLGGMLLPLGAFPPVVGAVAAALPFSALVYGPASLALGGPDVSFWSLAARQAITLALAGAAVWALYRAALRRVNANGG